MDIKLTSDTAEDKPPATVETSGRADEGKATPFHWLVQLTVRQARRLVIGVAGTTVVLLGAVMIFTPGPAMVLIPAGLAILAIEFVWARRLLRRVRIQARWNLRKARNRYRTEKNASDP